MKFAISTFLLSALVAPTGAADITDEATLSYCNDTDITARVGGGQSAIACANDTTQSTIVSADTTACTGNMYVARIKGNTFSRSRIFIANSGSSEAYKFDTGNGLVAFQLTDTAPPACTAPAAGTSGVGSVSLSNAAMQQDVAGAGTNGYVSICSGTSEAPATGVGASPSSSVHTTNTASTAACTAAAPVGVIEFGALFQCPDMTTATKTNTTTYLTVGAASATVAGGSYMTLAINCGYSTDQPKPNCARWYWCTPPTGQQYSGTSGAINSESAYLTTCENGITNGLPCQSSNRTVRSTFCTGRTATTGMNENHFEICAPEGQQITSLTTAIRGKSFADIPSWATLYTSTSGSAWVQQACTGSFCDAPALPALGSNSIARSPAIPTSDQESIRNGLASNPTFSSGGVNIPTTTGGTVFGDASRRGRNAAAAQTGNLTAWASATCGGSSNSSSSCCDDFYRWMVCDLHYPTPLSGCNCGGSTTCPASVSCSSSNKKLLLLLLLLLLIPLFILLACILLLCCWKRRQKNRGWEERQLQTFDPEPHPAAPPPPVNVYEDAHHHDNHHDNFSGYSDVHNQDHHHH